MPHTIKIKTVYKQVLEKWLQELKENNSKLTEKIKNDLASIEKLKSLNQSANQGKQEKIKEIAKDIGRNISIECRQEKIIKKLEEELLQPEQSEMGYWAVVDSLGKRYLNLLGRNNIFGLAEAYIRENTKILEKLVEQGLLKKENTEELEKLVEQGLLKRENLEELLPDKHKGESLVILIGIVLLSKKCDLTDVIEKLQSEFKIKAQCDENVTQNLSWIRWFYNIIIMPMLRFLDIGSTKNISKEPSLKVGSSIANGRIVTTDEQIVEKVPHKSNVHFFSVPTEAANKQIDETQQQQHYLNASGMRPR